MIPPKTYQTFIFESYTFEPATGLLELHYSLDEKLNFTESYRFDFSFADYNAEALDRALFNLFIIAGVSYYKMYLPAEIKIKQGQLSASSAEFFSNTYQQGLGEFFFVNQLDPRTPITFPHGEENPQALPGNAFSRSLLIGIGGGKDSLVSAEILRNSGLDVATWSVNHRPQLTPLIKRIGLPHYWVERQWDPKIEQLNKLGALNGHIPISAIFACVGTVVAVLSGRQDVVVSNEQSANEPTLNYQGVDINHQYSKSQAFEQAYQVLLKQDFGEQVRYYSFLRPFSEVRIAEIFARLGFEKYKDVFSSCNRAFVHGSDHMFWDGTCPKCAFVFLTLTPFVERAKLEALFSGKNLLLDPELAPTYKQLLGIEGDKPLECVGEVKESRAAMRLARQQYPELAKTYQFELPDNYDFRALGTHHMPPQLYDRLIQETTVL